jgi:cellulose synthase/poly-beta-1,6-N-acetylglucosamine synthase-like glycosyltransferase/spore germination protein YaaH/peptidoglycan/xylan/chitin deacetylase (PgdA/CDA1 family)
MSNPIFFDPDRRRWKRIRKSIDIAVVVFSLLIVFFAVTVVRKTSIPNVLLADQKKNYRALKSNERKKPVKPRVTHRKTLVPATQVVLNSGEGIRGAFYVTWDAASYSSLREYIHQLDFVFPEWLHVLAPDGHLQAVDESNTLFNVLNNGRVANIDAKLMPFIKSSGAQVEVLPMVNNFDPIANEWRASIGTMLQSQAGRQRFRQEIAAFLASDNYKGITLDIEGFPEEEQPGYRALISELATDLHQHNQKLYISVPSANSDFDYAYLGKLADGLILMNYDQHYPGGDPGAVAGQDWFTQNLVKALKVVPREKIICAIGNYGYDWTTAPNGKPGAAGVHNVSVQDAWLEARDSEADVSFDSDLLNPHFTYLDEKNLQHDVWFLDAVTALNQMRAARELGISTFALWRLGSEDRSLWKIWDAPRDSDAPVKLEVVDPGQDVDIEGEGDILRIAGTPEAGTRDLTIDSTGLITDEVFRELPTPYVVDAYGAPGKRVVLSFDDGPDPEWTPKVLDVLKQYNVHGIFFTIGLEAEKYPGLLKRIYREGNEIGNHTFTHPDISSISPELVRVELNLTERLLAAKLGIKPALFRPPYSVDQEPDTADEVRPLELTQSMGYTTVGDKIDPDDWHDNPRPSPEQITQSVMDQLSHGSIILLHDGGGNRANTVKALPMIIEGLHARGYQIVSVHELLGKTYADVMVPISRNERFWATVDSAGFLVFGAVSGLIVFIFFVGDVLMSGRLILVGACAIFDRLRRHSTERALGDAAFQPAVAVLIPAYNEEKVINRTIRSVLHSTYPNLRVVVIDDGSSDRTAEVARETFANEIARGRVTVLRQENGGKASALNYALQFVTEEIFVGIDADTLIGTDAVAYLVPHFQDLRVGAMAGNAKVGNRVNLWTRWQALEYITSQNFDRRALNTFSCVSVVPGAIGAWRTEAVRAANGYKTDTVAEDADLTMALLQDGYKVEYEDRALAFTEAPTTANGLMRQRFRWSFGILQAVWKHRSAFKQKGALGYIALPNIIIFQILLPLVSPFIDIMFVVGTLKYLIWDKHFHPETADPASFDQLVLFFLMFLMIDFIASTIAFSLERRHGRDKRDWWLLGHVWLQRFAYRQLFSVVLIKTLRRAIDGRHFSWDKLERTATVTEPERRRTLEVGP